MRKKTDEEESPKVVYKKRHRHIGPNARGMKTGRAFCPVCDAERILREKFDRPR